MPAPLDDAASGGDSDGCEGVRLVSQLAGVAISVPVVAGFVLLGAAVLVGGSLLDVGRKLLEMGSPRFPAASGLIVNSRPADFPRVVLLPGITHPPVSEPREQGWRFRSLS